MKEKLTSLPLLKTSALQKTLAREWKDETQSGRKYVRNISDKELVSKIYKELLKLNNNEKPNQSVLTLSLKRPEQTLHQDIQVENEHIKKCSTSYFTRELQIKMRYRYLPTRMAKIQNNDKDQMLRRM